MFLNLKKKGTNFLNISNLQDDHEYNERPTIDISKKPDSIKLLQEKLKGVTKKVSHHSKKNPTIDFQSNVNHLTLKTHDHKHSFYLNNLKEQLDLSKNVLDVIKLKNQRSSHSNPKVPKQDNINSSKDKNHERSNSKNTSFMKNKGFKELEFDSPKIKDLKVKYLTTKNEQAKKVYYGIQEENIKNNLFKKAMGMKKLHQTPEEKKDLSTTKFAPKESFKMKEFFMNNLKIHDEEELTKTIDQRHTVLEIKTSKDQKKFEFPKYLQNYTCSSKEKSVPKPEKDKLTEYKEFLKEKMKQINEKMEFKLKVHKDEVDNINNTTPNLENENSIKHFNNLRYKMTQKNLDFQQQLTDKPDKTSKFKEEYIVGKEIGQGAYATVRIAIHKASKTRVAIKIYEKTRIMDPQRKKNVKREIKLLKMMSHPYIIKLHEAFETNHHINIIMEYVGGPSLYSYLKSQPNKKLNENEARRIFRQITEALIYCHSKCITHRDIKLENMLMDENKNIKLIDFGFSTFMPNDQKVKMFCGTPSYMAPEIVLKKEYYGPPADVWALGVLLFALLCGFFPYKGSTDHELYTKISKADYSIPGNLSNEVKNLLRMIFAIDSSKRPTAEEILNHEWLYSNEFFSNNDEFNTNTDHFLLNKHNLFQQKRNDEKSQKKRDNTPEEKIFYSPNTFYVNAQNLYININETANINWEEKPPKPKTSLQNKHSLIINNLNYACEKKLNVSSNTTKHKRNFTDNLKINPDFTYLDYRQEKAKEFGEELPSGQKKYNQTIFPSNVPSMMTLFNSNSSQSPSSFSNKNHNKIVINKVNTITDKSIKGIDPSKIKLNTNGNNLSFLDNNKNEAYSKKKSEDETQRKSKNIYENNGYLNYLDKEEFNSVLYLK